MPERQGEAIIIPIVAASIQRSIPGVMAEHGVTCSLSRLGNVWDEAAMEDFYSSLKAECMLGKVYRTRDQARADVFDYFELLYHPRRRHSKIGYLSPMAFEVRPDKLRVVATEPAAAHICLV